MHLALKLEVFVKLNLATIVCILLAACLTISTFSNCSASNFDHYNYVEDEFKGRPPLVYSFIGGAAFPIKYPDGNKTAGFALGMSCDLLASKDRTLGIYAEVLVQSISSEKFYWTVDRLHLLADGESQIFSSVVSVSMGPEYAFAPLGSVGARIIFRAGVGLAFISSTEKFRVEGFDENNLLTLYKQDKASFCYEASINLEIGKRFNIPWELSIQYFGLPKADYHTRYGQVSGQLRSIRFLLVASVWTRVLGV